ncbi:MAG: hypothetical protein KIG53_06990 [Oscillospiraceae bacterium]|nr:hypothetical protein [Oscillospiraceae bacterium]
MKFEVVNFDGETVFNTKSKRCIPQRHQIESMLKAGYKIKIDGKVVSKKKLFEIIDKQ